MSRVAQPQSQQDVDDASQLRRSLRIVFISGSKCFFPAGTGVMSAA